MDGGLRMSTLKFNKWQSTDGVTRNAVLQVVSQKIDTVQLVNSTSFIDTVMTASITPTSATSKILVNFTPTLVVSRSSSHQGIGAFQLLRDSNVIYKPYGETANGVFSMGTASGGTTSAVTYGNFPIIYLDAPATTSEVTYMMQAACFNSTALNLYINYITSVYNQSESTVTLMEIAQ
jgi:hypothetical protein